MLIFPIYAVLVWSAAMHWRRRWPSFAAVAAGVFALVFLQRIFLAWGDHIPAEYKHVLILIVPYTALIGAVGLFIAVLPRRVSETACRACGYELRGLNPVDLSCPECGREWRGVGSRYEVKPPPLIPIPKGPPKKRRTI